MKREKEVNQDKSITYRVSENSNAVDANFDNRHTSYCIVFHSSFPISGASKTYDCRVTGGACYGDVGGSWGEALKNTFDKHGEEKLYLELETIFRRKFHRGLKFVVTPETAMMAMSASASQHECPFCGTKVGKNPTTPWEYSKRTVTDPKLLQRFPEFNGLVFYIAPHADCFPAQLGAMKRGLRASHEE